MHFLIDGYNLIFTLIESKKSLQSQREEVISYLQEEFSRKKIKGTIVFDGAHRREEESGLSYRSPLVVAFAPKGQSADDYIVEKLEISKNAKIITVVTNDRGLHRHALGLSAKIQSNEDFIAYLNKKKKTQEIREAKDSPKNIDRLQKIFEKRLEEES